MDNKITSTESLTDWNRIDAMQDEDIDLSDIPEITEAQFARANLRLKGKPIQSDEVPVLLDADLIAYFKKLAGEKKPPTVVNKNKP